MMNVQLQMAVKRHTPALQILVVDFMTTAHPLELLEVQRQPLLGGLVMPTSGPPRKPRTSICGTPSLYSTAPTRSLVLMSFWSAVQLRVAGSPEVGGSVQVVLAFSFSTGIRICTVSLSA